jgi:hypothetical protein
MKKIIHLLFFTLLFVSCKWDRQEYENCAVIEECKDIPYSTSLIGYQDWREGVLYSAPCFNPLNPDEFVYLEQNWVNNFPQNSLVIYNMSTHQSNAILTGRYVIAEPIWTIKNEIYFWDSSWEIYKIKPDGSELTNVTNRGGCRFPAINPEGSKLFFHYNPNNDLSDGLIMDLTTSEIIDTVVAGSCSDWSDSNLLISNQGSTIVTTYNVATREFKVVYDYEVENTFLPTFDIKVDKAGQYIYFSAYQYGLKRINLQNNSVTEIKQACDSHDFKGISIHPNNTKMLVAVEKNTKVNETRIIIESEIWLMDTDGCNSIRVLPK